MPKVLSYFGLFFGDSLIEGGGRKVPAFFVDFGGVGCDMTKRVSFVGLSHCKLFP